MSSHSCLDFSWRYAIAAGGGAESGLAGCEVEGLGEDSVKGERKCLDKAGREDIINDGRVLQVA